MAYKQFTPDVLSSAEVNTYLMKQAVVVFADATARTNALGATPPTGMVTFLTASNTFWYYDGSTWINLGNVMRFASSAARSTALSSPQEGMISYLQDVDELEVYNGTSWLRVVVTSDDEGFTTTGPVTANNAGADGGISLRAWTGNSAYQSLATTNMASTEYMVISDGTDTFVSAGTGGSVNLRPSANNTSGQMNITTGQTTINSGVAAGGLIVNAWPDNTTFQKISTANMASNRYMIMSNGASTFISSGSGGNVTLRGPDNTSSPSVTLGSSTVDIQGILRQIGSPGFYGQNAGGHTTNYIGIWNPTTIRSNNGGYNTSNGRFTAGASGYVLCCFSSLINTPQTNSHFYTYFTKNGAEASGRIHTDYAQPRSYEPISHTAVINVGPSDYIECYVNCQVDAAIYASPWGGELMYWWLG